MNGIRMLVIAVATAVTSGCATMIPDYQRPQLPVAQDWSAVAPFGEGESELRALAEVTYQTRETSLELTQRNFDAGVVSVLDLS